MDTLEVNKRIMKSLLETDGKLCDEYIDFEIRPENMCKECFCKLKNSINCYTLNNFDRKYEDACKTRVEKSLKLKNELLHRKIKKVLGE